MTDYTVTAGTLELRDGHAGIGPFDVPGVGRCDRDRCAGDAAALAAFWAANC